MTTDARPVDIPVRGASAFVGREAGPIRASVRCSVLIGTRRYYRKCGLRGGDPCSSHRVFDGPLPYKPEDLLLGTQLDRSPRRVPA